jgi:hypothetical protein
MATKEKSAAAAIRNIALRLGEVDVGVACAGTPVESTTFRRKKKAFLFLGAKNGAVLVRLKLNASVKDASKLAAKEPERYEVGAHGWTKITLAAGAPLPRVLAKWIAESYEAIA